MQGCTCRASPHRTHLLLRRLALLPPALGLLLLLLLGLAHARLVGTTRPCHPQPGLSHTLLLLLLLLLQWLDE